MKVKSLDRITKKWQEVTPGRAQYYEEGVRTTDRDWKTETQAANASWKAGIAAAAAADLFSKGVAKAGTETWRARAISVGPGRFSEGVATAGPQFAKGFGPFLGVLSALTLPPKGPKGDPKNYERVRAVGMALRAKKVAG